MSFRTLREFQYDCNLSNNKIHKIENQLGRVYNSSKIIKIGESKYEYKKNAYLEAKIQEKKINSHVLNKNRNITGGTTKISIENRILTFTKYCFQYEGVKNIYEIKDFHVTKFLTQLVDRKYSKGSFFNFCTAIEKYETILDRVYEQNRGDFHKAIQNFKKSGNIDVCPIKNVDSRSFEKPYEIINNLPDKYKLAAYMQLENGLRISDASFFTRIDENYIKFKSKNGIIDIKEMHPKMKILFDKYSDENIYCVNRDKYNYQLKKACINSNQKWQGSHGLRHNFAQNYVRNLTLKGYDMFDACKIVSSAMQHKRYSIINTYLR